MVCYELCQLGVAEVPRHAERVLSDEVWCRTIHQAELGLFLAGRHHLRDPARNSSLNRCVEAIGAALPTIADSIKARMCVHGVNRPQFQVIPPPHEGLSRLPTQIITLFSNAFESTKPDGRPTAAAWGQALYQSAKHAGADLKPQATSGQGPAPVQTSPPPVPAGGISASELLGGG